MHADIPVHSDKSFCPKPDENFENFALAQEWDSCPKPDPTATLLRTFTICFLLQLTPLIASFINLWCLAFSFRMKYCDGNLIMGWIYKRRIIFEDRFLGLLQVGYYFLCSSKVGIV